MTATFVDTNVFLDIYTNDPSWSDWSAGQFQTALGRGGVIINDVVYAELSVRFEVPEMLDQMLADFRAGIEPIPRAALFAAGKAFLRYRRSGGVRTGVLPDFFIGAHAAAAGVPLLTRDPGRYRTYFPTISLLAP